MDVVWAFCYLSVLIGLSGYGLHRYFIVYLFLKNRKRTPQPLSHFEQLPVITVQLPLFNEIYVVERLLKSVSELDYPRKLLHIQVLDDSTDETQQLTASCVQKLRERGFDVELSHRTNRVGYKAGALEAGLATARGDFVCILDADFMPQPELLRSTVHFFTDPKVGMIQTRWGHINRGYSLLTRVQAMFLDGHLLLEQVARSRSGRFFNFNGTAGLWRKSCIAESGGWQHDTLTEDLDLSYRAQLAGWKFVFLTDVVTPAELPVDMNGFKSQQHRWTKGSIQTGQKLLPAIFRSRFPWRVKAEAFFHLTNNFSHLLVVLLALLIVPAILIRERIGWQRVAILDFPLFFGATFSFIAFYVSSQREIGRDWKQTLKSMPLLLSLGIGLSLTNVHAVLEALASRKTGFARTPKFGIEGGQGEWRSKKYRAPGNFSLAAEILLAVYFFGAIVFAVRENYWVGVPFLLIFFNGFAYTASLSLASRYFGAPRRLELKRAPAPG